MMLRNAGHVVVETADGSQALKVAKQESFDLVLTDLIMPGKEGIETIMELRKSYPGIRIIAMSGGGLGKQQDYLGLAKQLGAVCTLSKPFGVDELNGAVENALSVGK